MSKQKVEKIIIDEIYTFYHHLYLYDENRNKLRKRNRSYLFNAIIVLKSIAGIKFTAILFKVYSSVSEDSLSDFLALASLPDSKQYFSDGAKIYQDCWIKKFQAKRSKSKETNIFESFNFYCRNFNPCLGRKFVTYAKKLNYFNHLMIEVVIRWA